ncbi:MAG: hypothetical protein ACI9UK_000013 [Candidatus Krumholzibacteriia bacterium]|jgi:hypothetical protein
MFRPSAIVLIIVSILATSVSAKGIHERLVIRDAGAESELELKSEFGPQVDTILGDFNFDGVGGALDPQGWTGVDAWAQTDTFFRIEDFAGMGGSYAPLNGAVSLWCGRRADPTDDPASNYPGYGNLWVQDFTSQPHSFIGSGSVNLSYQYRIDLEFDFDFLYVQYQGTSGVWRTLATHTGIGADQTSVTAPADSLSNMVRFRFVLETDHTESDEDGLYDSSGAVILDDLVITGPGFFEEMNFEGQSIGETVTSNDEWQAQQNSPFGSYAGLSSGSDILQEDPVYTNTTGLWAFIQGSSDLCTSYGNQIVVPNGRNLPSDLSSDHISNEIVSPEMSLLEDVDGNPIVNPPGTVILSFEIYNDLDIDAQVFYGVQTRYRINDTLTPWDNNGYIYYSDTKTWSKPTHEYTPPPGATSIQVGFTCRDYCPVAELCDGSTCHSQAPLFDNVKVVIPQTTIVVTNNADSGPGSLRAAITEANLLPNHDRITFDITGSSIIEPLSVLPHLFYPVEIDGTSQGNYGIEPLIEIDGGLYNSVSPAFTLRDSCSIRGLAIYDFPQNAVRLDGNDCVIEACHIGRSPYSEAAPGNGNYGIFVEDNALNSRIGGTWPGQGNVITGHPVRGIVVHGYGHAIRGNSIYNNGLSGIDLGENLITGNDFMDQDGGPNGQQNFPTVIHVDAATGTIEALLYSAPNEAFEIDLFLNTNCSLTNHGEGQTYLGSQTVQANSRGRAYLRFNTPLTLIPGRYITATATDQSNNTSEFSVCFEIPPVYVVTTPNDNAVGSLREAITAANADGVPSAISFNLPVVGSHLFTLTGPLPDLTESVVIDGYSQPGASQNTSSIDEGLDTNIILTLFGGGQLPMNGFNVLADNCRIQGFSIVGFNGNGIRIEASNTDVWGCFIGVRANGVEGLTNSLAGIRIDDLQQEFSVNYIGGEFPSQRNLISANIGAGVLVLDQRVLITGNLIGTDASGLVALGNNIGIEAATAGATNLSVGRNPQIDRNVISGNNQAGVQLGSNFGIVSYCYIGVGVDGITPLGNGTDGVRVISGTGNLIRGSHIQNNGQLGIDVEADGVSTAPVAFEAPPTITGLDIVQNQIYASFNTSINTQVRVQFFSNTTCDPSGYGEGQYYLGDVLVTTSAKVGNTYFAFNSPISLSEGAFISATVEHPTLGTSEFSQCFDTTNTPAGSNIEVNMGIIGNEAALTFDDVTTSGSTTASMGASGPGAPAGFIFGDPIEYWEIATTATFTGDIEVCLPYDPSNFIGDESELVLLHWDNTLDPPAWVDITTNIDTRGNEVCGTTSHLSPFVVATTAFVSSVGETVPMNLGISAAVPNPFNPMTTIHYDVPETSSQVSLKIYNLQGQLVRTLVNGYLETGRHQAVWQGRDDAGQSVASGVYLVRIEDGREHVMRKIVLVE